MNVEVWVYTDEMKEKKSRIRRLKEED